MKRIESSQRLAVAFCGILAIFSLRSSLSLLEYPLIWWVIILAAIIAVEAGFIALGGFSPLLQLSHRIGLRGAYWLSPVICLAAFGIFINSILVADWLMTVLNGIFTLALIWVSLNMISELKKNGKVAARGNIFYVFLIFVSVAGFVFIRSQQGIFLMPAAILALAMANIALTVLLSAIMSRK